MAPPTWRARLPLAEGDRFGSLREEIAGRYGIGEVTSPLARRAAFRAEVEAIGVGEIVMLDVAADALAVERSARDVGRSDPNLFVAGLVLEGSGTVTQNGREAKLGPSDLVLCESRSPFRIRFDGPFRQLLVQFDRARLEERLLDGQNVTAVRVDGGAGVGSVTAQLLRSLRDQAEHLGTNAEPLARHAIDLLTLTFAAKNASPAPSDRSERLLRAKILTFIEDNLADVALTPDLIAQRHRVSRRYLYRLFESGDEAVFELIRRLRLERCRAELVDPAHADRTIAEVAFGWGFNDLSHFSRVFRRTYGESPGAFRRARRAPDVAKRPNVRTR